MDTKYAPGLTKNALRTYGLLDSPWYGIVRRAMFAGPEHQEHITQRLMAQGMSRKLAECIIDTCGGIDQETARIEGGR